MFKVSSVELEINKLQSLKLRVFGESGQPIAEYHTIRGERFRIIPLQLLTEVIKTESK